MKATIKQGEFEINSNHRKEHAFSKQYTLVHFKDNQIKLALEVRIYRTKSRSYACVWLRGEDGWNSGSGFAGGYGYCKDSAAVHTAFTNAGIELSESISGRGHTAIRTAIIAVGEALGLEHGTIIEAHG